MALMWLVYTLLAALMWAGANVIDSMVIHKYERNPVVLMWFMGPLRAPFLLLLALLYDVRTPWALHLFSAGALLYLGALLYFHILKFVDASVTQTAWAFESIILTVVGFFWLNESWSHAQTVGAALILVGVFILVHWHNHISVTRTLSLLLLLAVVVSPCEINIKLAVNDGTSIAAAMFWYILGMAVLAVIAPIAHIPTYRRITSFALRAPHSFYAWFFFDTAIGIIAYYLITKAYASGTLSLVTIAGNSQPFLVIFLAWLLTKLSKTHVPKELLTKQSLHVKLASFSLVFMGLALLAN